MSPLRPRCSAVGGSRSTTGFGVSSPVWSSTLARGTYMTRLEFMRRMSVTSSFVIFS